MDLEFTSDQNIIRNSARRFLQHECPKSKIRELKANGKGYDPELWEKIVELGWPGLMIPEIYGGSGAEYIDLMILMEEVGRNILPGPFFSTVALPTACTGYSPAFFPTRIVGGSTRRWIPVARRPREFRSRRR